jgi:hypothetical protein
MPKILATNGQCLYLSREHKMHIKSVTYNSIVMVSLKILLYPSGIRTRVPEVDAVSTGPRRMGILARV